MWKIVWTDVIFSLKYEEKQFIPNNSKYGKIQ